jgi:type IV fimbrial biogenesis protein FimT
MMPYAGHRSRAARQRGFTLVELIVVLAILAIGVSFALPEMSTFLRRSEISNVTNELISGVNFARVEAIKRSAPVVLCPSNNGTTCTNTSGVWDDGYIVFVDANANGNRQTAATDGEDLIRYVGRFGRDVTVQSSGGASRVRFAPNGLMSGGAVGMRFQVGNSVKPIEDERRYICIAMAGRATAMNSATFLNNPAFAQCGP